MDELEISGKLYISSKKAAKQNKYHVDYIGQLIRGGKIIGTKVGRAWYVEASSLASYLNKEPEESRVGIGVPHSGVIAHTQEQKKEIPEVLLSAHMPLRPRVGLTYLSDSEEISIRVQKQQEDVAQIEAPYKTQRVLSSEVQNVKDSSKKRRSLAFPSFLKSLLPLVGRISFGFVTIGVFLLLFGFSYQLSYTASPVDGQEANAFSFSR